MTQLVIGLRQTLAVLFFITLVLGSDGAVHAAPLSQEIEEVTLRIVNEAKKTICHIHITPITSSEWGDDWLGGGETIPPGGSRLFRVTPGNYDILLVDCDSIVLRERGNVNVTGHDELLYGPADEAAQPCDGLRRSAGALHAQAQYREAEQEYQEALTCYRQIGHRQGEARSLANLGIVYYSLSQYATAIDYYEQSLAIARQVGDRKTEGTCLGYLGVAHRSLGQYATAIDYYEGSLAIAREVGDRKTEEHNLGNLGNVYHVFGEYAKAIEYHEQALAIAREIGDRDGQGNHLGNLGKAYDSLGQYAMAINYYEQALTIAREIGDRKSEEDSLGALGNPYLARGQYATAIEYYSQALAIAQDIGHRQGQGVHLNNLGNAYLALGQPERTLEYFEQALAIAREIGDRKSEGGRLGSLGNAYYSMDQYKTAIEYYQDALLVAREVGNRQSEGSQLGNLGNAYESLGDYEKATHYYKQALAIAREIGDRDGEAIALGSLANAYNSLGEYDKDIEHYEEAIAIAREIGDRSNEATHLTNLGNAYEFRGNHAMAIACYKQAIEIVEAMRSELRVSEFKTGFTAENLGPYEALIETLLEHGRLTEAFEYVQRAKARAFLDQMGNPRIDPRATNDPTLIEEEEALRNEIQALQAQLSEEENRHSQKQSNQDVDSLKARLQDRRAAYEDLLVRLKLENPEYASLVAVETSTLTETQKLLAGTTLVEYYTLPSQTIAFVVGEGEFHVKAAQLPMNFFYGQINRFYVDMRTTHRGIPESLRLLYTGLIAPIEPYLNTDRVLIAPHDALHYVPFAALHDGERYLIESYTLTEVPSASLLPFVQERVSQENPTGLPLILGNPSGDLPSSADEAQSVAEIYGTNAHIGRDALEQLVWDQGPNAGVLHLATHGIYNEKAPMFSRLLLTNTASSRHDGVLEVHEVYNLDLSVADLVVLSGCETNLGEHSRGDEIVGLTRAFTYAGARSVISTLWSIEDAASRDLMVAFYGYLQEGIPKAEALRKAQIDLLRDKRTAHPFYWAGFVLSGDAGSLAAVRRPIYSSSGGDKRLLLPTLGTRCCIVTLGMLLLSLLVTAWIWSRKRGERTDD